MKAKHECKEERGEKREIKCGTLEGWVTFQLKKSEHQCKKIIYAKSFQPEHRKRECGGDWERASGGRGQKAQKTPRYRLW
jgi:hypothetical protein